MYRTHVFEYVPVLVGGRKRYLLELPVDSKPIIYRTMTSEMGCWFGEVEAMYMDGTVRCAVVRTANGPVKARIGSLLRPGHPCYVWEHLTVDGSMELVATETRIENLNLNFVNFGVPYGKHIRIDIYTGDYRILNG